MKIKKESKQSQVGPGTHFPCDVPGHPQPLHRAQADPFAALSAGEAFQGESIYMELKLHIEAPMFSHNVCISLHFVPPGSKEPGGGRLLVPGQLAGFFISCFLQPPHILEIFPKQLLLL